MAPRSVKTHMPKAKAVPKTANVKVYSKPKSIYSWDISACYILSRKAAKVVLCLSFELYENP